MEYPNLSEEKKLWKKGYEIVVGIDEVGRGSLAGPVVAGAVIFLPSQIKNYFKVKNLLKSIKDSKKLSEKQRNKIYSEIINCSFFNWGVGIVSEKLIDKINILEATKLAIKKSVSDLKSKRRDLDFILIDGNMKFKWDYNYRSIIKGDQKVFSISAASIIAKVYRDNLMKKYHEKHPQYNFDKHKGYGTELHIKNLEKFGACKIHRKTFYPIKQFVFKS